MKKPTFSTGKPAKIMPGRKTVAQLAKPTSTIVDYSKATPLDAAKPVSLVTQFAKKR